MNKKHLIYSLQYAAVLASVLTFSSCKKDEFTAEQALDIENKRKQFQFDLDEKAKDNEAARANFMMWQARKIDSLQRVNAGGQVFYSVAVVPGGSSAFGQGRYEEVGLDNIDVTVEQYGFTYTVKTKKGIANFLKPLFSGEATVTVDAAPQGFTSVSYIANLTPDGGVPNDGTVFVGNIIPVFENDPSKAGAEDKMAMISGKAWADLDLTDGDGFTNDNSNAPNEEPVPDGVSFSAVIDVNDPVFKDKYLRENFDEGGIHIGGSGNTPGTGVATKSGFIQRIAYEKASTVARVSNGDYSMMVAATASGLPMKMRYSDFAFDRNYINNSLRLVQERCIYGPEAGYDTDFVFGSREAEYAFFVNYVKTPATLTAQLSRGTSLWTWKQDATYNWLRPVDGINVALSQNVENRFEVGGANAVTSNNNAGAYLHAPTIAFGAPDMAGGVQAIGEPIMYNFKTQGATGTTLASFGTSAFYNSNLANDAANRPGGLNLRGIRGVNVTNVGSGYSVAPAVTITPVFPGGEGTGSLQASSSGISYIRVINGGFGLVYSPGLHNVLPSSDAVGVTNPYYTTTNLSDNTVSYQGVNQFTGVLPQVVINGGIVPSGGALATAQVVVNATIGTIDEIYVTSTGSGYSPSTSAITFNIGSGAGIEYTTAAGSAGSGAPFILVNAGGGLSLAFNTGGGALSSVFAPGYFDGVTSFGFADADVTYNTGANYTFVPGVQVLNIFRNYDATAAAYTTTPANIAVNNLEIRATVQGGTGSVFGLSIIGTPSVVTGGLAVNDELRGQFNIVPRQDWPASAQAFLTGSGIDNYVVTAVGANYSNIAAMVGPGHTGGANSFNASTMYDYYTFAPGSGGSGGGFGGANAINNLTAYNLSDSDYDVEFYGATGLAGNPVTNPTAVPVFQSGGQTLAGIRIFSPGVNIAPAVGTEPAIRWRVVPRGYKAATIKAQLTPAAITFNIVDGGLGYALRPVIVLTTDKLTYFQTAPLNHISNYKFNINNAGTITSIEFAPNFTGASAVMSLLNDAATAGTLQAPIVSVAAQEGLMANVANGFFTNGTQVSSYFFAQGGQIVFFGNNLGAASGAVFNQVYSTIANGTAFGGIGGGVGSPATMHWPWADFDNATGTADGAGGFGTGNVGRYYTDFRLTVRGAGRLWDVENGVYQANGQLYGLPGSGATANVILSPANGTVSGVQITSGGSGYGSVYGFNRQPITFGFTVFGGPDGYVFGTTTLPGGGRSGNAARFETYSGIQYVRDIHYGIGRRIH
jgi:hypothetical protein